MAKGTITFEFENIADLSRQMRLVLIDEVRGALDRTIASPMAGKSTIPIPASYPVEPLYPLPAEETTGATTIPCPTPPSESTKATMEEVRQINREVAAAATAVGAMFEVATAPEPAAATSPAPTDQNSPTLTLENLATAPYPELLAFCDAHPEVGVNTETSKASFFRKLVEHKIKTYLETK